MLSVLLAVLGALAIVAGVALWAIPAAVVVAGVELVLAAYVVRYLEANR